MNNKGGNMERETDKFIDQYFQSTDELLNMMHPEKRDTNTLFSYLNNLHSTAEKLKTSFGCNIKDSPDFKVLRLIRNFFHHNSDVDEIRINVKVNGGIIVSHIQHIIIPLEIFAKSIKSFKNKNKEDFVNKEMKSIGSCFDYVDKILNDIDEYCDKPSFQNNGRTYELGFDIYKFIYNISNLIADKCRNIEQLANKQVVLDLDDRWTVENNISKYDIVCHAGNVPIMTTEGFVYLNHT